MLQAAKSFKDDEQRGCMSYQFAAARAREQGFYPEEATLQKREQQYLKKFAVPEWAEDRARKVKAHARASWCIEEYFRQHKVQMEGPLADSVEKAFQVVPGELTVFPFYWDTQIVEGILAMPLLDVLVMDTITVGSGTAVHAVMNETLTDRQMGETGEFATMQEVNITSSETAVKLKKFGGLVTVSDEAMRRQRIPVFSRGIARVGRQIGIDMTDLAVDIVINGDLVYGGLNDSLANQSPSQSVAAAVAGSPTYSDYVNVYMTFPIGYEASDGILTRSGIKKMLNVPEFKDPLAGFKFQNQAILPEAFGLGTHRWDSAGSSTWNPSTVGTGTSYLVVQRQRALILYQEGGLVTESDRDVRAQSTVVSTSWYLIFSVWDRLAAVVGTGFA